MKNPIKIFSLRNTFRKSKSPVIPGISINSEDNVSSAKYRREILNTAYHVINNITSDNYDALPVQNAPIAGDERMNEQEAIPVQQAEEAIAAAPDYYSQGNDIHTHGRIAGREIISEIANQNNYEGSQSNNYLINKDISSGTSAAREFEEDLKARSIIINSFARAGSRAFKSMWNELIKGGKDAQEPWEALWLSFSKTALKNIGDIIASLMFKGMPGTAAKSKGDSSPLGLLSSIASLFAAGPAGAAIAVSQSLLGKSSALNETMPHSLVSTDAHSLVSAFSKYAEAAEKWQREFKVVNDVFETNRAIKTVQEYLTKIKS